MSNWPVGRARHGGVDPIALPLVTGRLSLCGKHFVGPDPEAALGEAEADVIVCLCEETEMADRYPAYVAWLRTNTPRRALWHPIPDLHAPPVDDALMLLGDLRVRLAVGDRLLMHCGAGIGRAGTIAAGLLVNLGVPLDQAMATVAASRPMAGPEAGVQRELLDALVRRTAG